MAKLEMNFSGVEYYLNKIKELGGDAFLDEVAGECLETAFNIYTPNLKQAWAPHDWRFSGATGERLIEKPQVFKSREGTYSTYAGFKIDQTTGRGLPSIFVAYGSPTTPGDPNLVQAMENKQTKRQITAEQKKILERAILEAMK